MAFDLPRLPIGGFSQGEFQIWWQQVVEAIEAQESAQDQVIADLATTQADLATAQADLATAQTDLATAQADIAAAQADIVSTQADLVAAIRDIARLASYPNPGSIITAADVGIDVTITIANHDRVYPGAFVPDVAIIGGTLTGKAFSTRYYIYYDDATLADTTPTFVATTSSATAQVGAAVDRHFVGYVDTPADGGSGTGGTGGGPPGGGGGGGGGQIP
jgi:hypothetical protein